MNCSIYRFIYLEHGVTDLVSLSAKDFQSTYKYFSKSLNQADCNHVQTGADFAICFIEFESAFFEKSLLKLSNELRWLHDDSSLIYQNTLTPSKGTDYLPIIFIGRNNLEDSTNSRLKNYYDCCIWNKYISLYHKKGIDSKAEKKTSKEFLDELQASINGIADKKDLYRTPRCREFIEFETRQFINSYLQGGAHKEVFPFQFHSEKEVELKNQKTNYGSKYLEKVNNRSRNYEWNILIIDDDADKRLDKTDTEKEIERKSYYIDRLLSKALGIDLSKSGSKSIFRIKTISNVNQVFTKEGLEKLSKDKFKPDVIMLDYLFKVEGSEKPDYGTELLSKIYNAFESGINKDYYARFQILSKFWIFPISSFNMAMEDDMREENIPPFISAWYLSDGADPLNTPEIFVYKFFQFIEFQMNEAGLEYNGKTENWEIKAISLLRKFHREEESGKAVVTNHTKGPGSVAKTAADLYPIFSNLYGIYHKIRTESAEAYAEEKNRFLFSVWEINYEGKYGRFLDHCNNLLFLLAYHTSPQTWQELFEEYIYVSKFLTENGFDFNIKEVYEYINHLRKQTSSL